MFWVWLCEKDNSAFPQCFRLLTTKHAFGFYWQERCLATHLWALLLAKSLVSSRCCLCSASFDGGTASSLEAPIDSTPPQTPFLKGGFMASLPLFPLYVVQLQPTSPGDPYSTSHCNQSDGRFRQYVSIQREWGVVGIQSMREELSHGLHRKDVRVHQLSESPFLLTSFSPSVPQPNFLPPSSACPR